MAKEFTVGNYSTAPQAKKALNTATRKGWAIESIAADGRQLWVVFSREYQGRDDGATDPDEAPPAPPPRPRAEPAAGGEFD